MWVRRNRDVCYVRIEEEALCSIILAWISGSLRYKKRFGLESAGEGAVQASGVFVSECSYPLLLRRDCANGG